MIGSMGTVRSFYLAYILIHWDGDEVEGMPADASVDIAMTDGSSIWVHDKVWCLIGLDIWNYDFLSASKDGL